MVKSMLRETCLFRNWTLNLNKFINICGAQMKALITGTSIAESAKEEATVKSGVNVDFENLNYEIGKKESMTTVNAGF